MSKTMRTLWAMLAVLGAGVLSAPAETNERLEALRKAFEDRMNAQLDEAGQSARKLRQGYLDALQKLKIELGREEKLKAAAQVVTELDAVEDGDETQPLPEGADYRLKRLRKTWDDGLESILAERDRKVAETAKLYFKALDDEKRKLTRAGRIKDALLFEEEEKRVMGLPEVAAVIAPGSAPGVLRGKRGEGDLARASAGATVTTSAKGAKETKSAAYVIDGASQGYNRARGYFFAPIPCTLDVDLGGLYVVDRIRLLLFDMDDRKYRYKVNVSVDGSSWDTISDPVPKSVPAGWQEFNIEPRDMRFIQVEGLGHNLNDDFHIVELEAYSPAE